MNAPNTPSRLRKRLLVRLDAPMAAHNLSIRGITSESAEMDRNNHTPHLPTALLLVQTNAHDIGPKTDLRHEV